MSVKPPGHGVHRLLARWVDPVVLRDVVEPTIADLQHEMQASEGLRWRRHLILLRGYVALLRALLLCGVRSRGTVWHGAALALLSVSGAALMTWARSTNSDTKIFNSALILPMLVAPVVLRALGAGASFGRLFAGGVAVGLIARVFAGGFALTNPSSPLLLRAVQLSFACLPVMLLSAAAAAAAWRPSDGRKPFVRQLVLAVFAGGLAAALAFGPIIAWPHGATPAAIAAMVPFYVCLFGVILTVTLVPLILILRGWVHARATLAAAAAFLSPTAICSSYYMDGNTIRQCLEMLRDSPGTFIVHGLPWIVGATVLGWRLARQPSESASVASIVG